jgi:redox-sensitive bicupin YhaK (pirin superfamily)
MTLRSVKSIYPAFQDDIGDLRTFRPVPSPLIDLIDPFLFLNHHGPQVYSSDNPGLPFGPHPHRGFQTVTFILKGDIAHRDSAGHESVIGPGGVQWMSAGRGLVHEEVSSERSKKEGGALEILQLWVNLPARLKMSDPYYVGLQAERIPVVELEPGKVRAQVIAGQLRGVAGPFTPSTGISVRMIELKAGGQARLEIPARENLFFYVVRGSVQVNGKTVEKLHLVEFGDSGEELDLQAANDSLVLLCHAEPYGEPVVAAGPFVMNTRAEIEQAIQDYRSGKFR